MKYIVVLLLLFNYSFSQTKDNENILKVISHYDSIIDIEPKADLFFIRATNLEIIKEYQKALADYDQSIKLDSTRSESYFNRAKLKSELRRNKEAIIDYNKAITLNDSNAKAYFNRGLVKLELNKKLEALEDFSKSIKLDPTNALSFSKRGVLKMENEKYAEAVKDFDIALKLKPNLPEAIQNRGISKAYLGDKNAINDFNLLVKIDPSGEAYFNRAVYYLNNNIKHDICPDLKKSLEFGHEDAKEYLKKYCK